MTRSRIARTATIGLAVALCLGGCATTTTSIPAGTSELMQSMVLTAANQAAAGDSPAALSTLDVLQTQLQQSTSQGQITSDRAASIQQAIDLVRSDLQPAPAAPVAPTVTDTPAPDPVVDVPTDAGNNGNGNNGNGNNGNGNNGNGNNGNGNNGNGNGKNK